MFNGIWLVASEPLEVQGREIATGERFQISRIHSGALLAQGRATVAPKIPPEPTPEPEAPTPRRRRARKIQTTTITAETETSGYPESNLKYQRRDLEAEE